MCAFSSTVQIIENPDVLCRVKPTGFAFEQSIKIRNKEFASAQRILIDFHVEHTPLRQDYGNAE
jgi:hypothetical protein